MKEDVKNTKTMIHLLFFFSLTPHLFFIVGAILCEKQQQKRQFCRMMLSSWPGYLQEVVAKILALCVKPQFIDN